MKKVFTRELIVLWVALAALIIAALSLNSSLNRRVSKEEQETD